MRNGYYDAKAHVEKKERKRKLLLIERDTRISPKLKMRKEGKLKERERNEGGRGRRGKGRQRAASSNVGSKHKKA